MRFIGTFLSALVVVNTAAAQVAGSTGGPVSGFPIVRFIQVEPDVKLEVVDYGGSGRAVILLHGHGRSAHDFDGFGPRLATTNHVYAISRRGYGASSRPAEGYTADRLADDVLAVVDSLKLVAPVVAGHSLAGEELSSIGSRHPEKVSGLVYLDAAYQYAFFDSARNDPANDFINPNEVRHGLDQLLDASLKGNAEQAHRLIARLINTDLPALRQTLEDFEKRTPPVSSSPPRPIMMGVRPGPDKEIFRGTQRFTSVRAPVLAIFALKGNTAALDDWNSGRRGELMALKRAAPSARTLILPAASHDVFNSAADEVLNAMRSFIGGLSSAR